MNQNKILVWTFHYNDRQQSVWQNHANKISHISIWGHEVDSYGNISFNTSYEPPATFRSLKNDNNIVLLNVTNNGSSSIFNNLRTSTTVQANFLNALESLLNTYTWVDGLDIDLEQGGDNSYRSSSRSLFSAIRSRFSSKHINLCLPAMNANNNSLGGENWCYYEDYNQLADSVAIMSYGYGWAGSAPKPVSPYDWVKECNEFALENLPTPDVFLGFGVYGFNYDISKPYFELDGYRGTSNTYTAVDYWLNGDYTFNDETQSSQSTCGYWSDYWNSPYTLLHIYHEIDGADPDTSLGDYSTSNFSRGTYEDKRFITGLSKNQYTTDDTASQTLSTTPDGFSGDYAYWQDGSAMVFQGECELTWTFTATSGGNRFLILEIDPLTFNYTDYYCKVQRAGSSVIAYENTWEERRLGYPGWFKTGIKVAFGYYDNKSISVLNNQSYIITLNIPANRVLRLRSIYLVPSTYAEQWYCGDIYYPIQGVLNYNKQGVQANQSTAGVNTAVEVLRSTPDTASPWYDSFTSDTSSYYTNETTNASWYLSTYQNRLECQSSTSVAGNGKYYFNTTIPPVSVDIRTQVLFGSDSSGIHGSGGVFIAEYSARINTSGTSTLGTIALYRNNTYVVTSSSIDLTAYIAGDSVTIGMRFIPDDAAEGYYYYYIYYEASRTVILSGRIQVTGDLSEYGVQAYPSTGLSIYFNYFRVGSGDEYALAETLGLYSLGTSSPTGEYKSQSDRDETYGAYNEFGHWVVKKDATEAQSREGYNNLNYNDYDYIIEPDPISLSLRIGNYKLRVYDPGLWITKLYRGDADGMGILYYSDVNSFKLFQSLAQDLGSAGVCFWTLGMEDPRIWEELPELY